MRGKAGAKARGIVYLVTAPGGPEPNTRPAAYIGSTNHPLPQRLRKHIRQATPSPKYENRRSVLSKYLETTSWRPTADDVTILSQHTGATPDELLVAEQEAIRTYCSSPENRSHPLLNKAVARAAEQRRTPCPVCQTPIHPASLVRHLRTKHPDQDG